MTLSAELQIKEEKITPDLLARLGVNAASYYASAVTIYNATST
jgi:hypothetical protein